MWRIATVSAALLGALTATAAAADRTGAPVTAVNSASVTLNAQPTTGAGVCLDVARDGASITDTLCPAPSPAAMRALSMGGRTVLFGATPQAVRRVDITIGRRTVKARTRAAGGFATTRFYAVTVPGTPAIGAVTARGSNRRIRRARDLDPFGLPRLGSRFMVARVSDERDQPSRLVAVGTRVLADKRTGHRVAALCAGLRTGGVLGRPVCSRKPTSLQFRFSASCDTGRQILYGIAPSFIRSAKAVLDNGTRQGLGVRRVPRRVGRAGTVLVAQIGGARARRVLVYDGHGRHVGSAALTGGKC